MLCLVVMIAPDHLVKAIVMKRIIIVTEAISGVLFFCGAVTIIIGASLQFANYNKYHDSGASLFVAGSVCLFVASMFRLACIATKIASSSSKHYSLFDSPDVTMQLLGNVTFSISFAIWIAGSSYFMFTGADYSRAGGILWTMVCYLDTIVVTTCVLTCL